MDWIYSCFPPHLYVIFFGVVLVRERLIGRERTASVAEWTPCLPWWAVEMDGQQCQESVTLYFQETTHRGRGEKHPSHLPLQILRVVSVNTNVTVFVIFASCEEVLLDWCLSLTVFSNPKEHRNKRNTISTSTKNLSKSLEGKRKESCRACVGSISATSIPGEGGWTVEGPGSLLGCERWTMPLLCAESRSHAAAGSIRLPKLVTLCLFCYRLFPIIFPLPPPLFSLFLKSLCPF